jgi:uncharacterized membrane protein YbhN (UPF0104 family)
VSTGRRIALTTAAGVLLGLATLVAEAQAFPNAGANEAIDSPLIVLATIGFFVVPWAVGRWWVVLSMAGPAVALLVMQAAKVPVRLDDGTGGAINYRTIFQFIVLSLVMLAVSGVRLLFVAHQSDQPG